MKRNHKKSLGEVLVQEPAIRLFGAVDEAFFGRFLEQLRPLRGQAQPLILELSTNGGDADVARRIAEEVRLCREVGGMDLHFVGKTMVYSAGVMIMAAFPVEKRFLSRDAVLLIHAWQIEKKVRYSGSLRVCQAAARDFLAELEMSHRLECQTFNDLVRGTQVSFERLSEQVSQSDWYVMAEEAARLELVAGLV